MAKFRGWIVEVNLPHVGWCRMKWPEAKDHLLATREEADELASHYVSTFANDMGSHETRLTPLK